MISFLPPGFRWHLSRIRRLTGQHVDESRKDQSYENVIMTSLENGPMQEDQLTLEEAREVQSCKVMVRLI